MTTKTKRRLRVLGFIAAGSFLLLLAGVLALHGYGRRQLVRVAAEFETRLDSLDPRAHELPAVPDSRNAALLLQRGAGALAWTDETKELIRRTGLGIPLSDWSEEDRLAIEAFLFEGRAAVDDLIAASALPESNYGVLLGGGEAPDLEALLALVRAQRLLKVEARFAFEASDSSRVLRATASMGRLAASLQGEPSLLHVLIGTGAETARLNLIKEIVASGTRDLELLRGLLAQVERLDTGRVTRNVLAADAAVLAATMRGDLPVEDDMLRQWLPLLGDLPEASFLDIYLRSLDVSLERFPALLDMTAPVSASVWTPWGDILSTVALPNWRVSLGRIHGAGVLRELARVALRLRIERIESDPNADDALRHLEMPAGEAFRGLPLVATQQATGAIELTLEGARELWDKMETNRPGEMALVWIVP